MVEDYFHLISKGKKRIEEAAELQFNSNDILYLYTDYHPRAIYK